MTDKLDFRLNFAYTVRGVSFAMNKRRLVHLTVSFVFTVEAVTVFDSQEGCR